MFGLSSIIGGAAGVLGGLTAPKLYRGKPFEQMTDADTRRDMFGRSIGRVEDWASGTKPLWTQGTINQRLSGQNARLDAAAGEARTNASERAIQTGQGTRGGMLDKRLAEIDRSLLDAKRQQAAPLYAQLAQQEPEYAMRAQSMLFPVLSQQEQMALAEHQRIEALKAARKAQGSTLHQALAGGAAGFVGGMGFGGGGGLFGFGGGQQSQGDIANGGWDWGQTWSPSINTAPAGTGNYDGGVDDTQYWNGGQG